MISVSCEYRFEAAHFLPMVDEGHKCRRMHGHNYRVVLTYHGRLDRRGMVRDFAEIDAVVAPLIEQIDNTVLNETCIFNPTAENIAVWFAMKTDADVVRVYETDGKWAEWRRESVVP